MSTDELQARYRRLRDELDAAYAARPWDGRRIDRIAGDLLPLERALAAQAAAAARHAPLPLARDA